MEASLGNPTRMSLENLSIYWKHWVIQDKKGDPFSFSSLDDNSGQDQSGHASDEDGNQEGPSHASDEDGNQEGPAEVPPPDHFSIDDDIPYPSTCPPNGRTNCLLRLVPKEGETNKMFHKLVKMVDTLEVSFILNL